MLQMADSVGNPKVAFTPAPKILFEAKFILVAIPLFTR
jgi:hypothetical protein